MCFELPTLRGQFFVSARRSAWVAVWAMGLPAWCGVLQVNNPAELAEVTTLNVFASAHALEANTFMSNRGLTPLFAGELYTGDVKYSPRKGKNLAISQSMWAVGLERPGWRFSVFQKQDAWLEIEEKTLDVLTANMAGRSLPNGQGLPVGVQFAGYDATGVKVEKAFAFQGLGHQTWALGLGISALMGNSLRLTEANGTVQPSSTGYLFNVNTNDSAPNATYPYIRDAKVSAEGYALDLGAKYRLNVQQTLGLAVNDAFSSVVWRNMPNSQLAINNQQVGKDANGFVKPTLIGMNDLNRRVITQTLEPKYQMDWIHADADRRWRLVGQTMRSHAMAGISHGLRFTGEHWLELGWESYFNALSFGYQGKYAKVVYRTRQPLSDQGNVAELSILGFVHF
jgi:hypothetical protein